MVSVIVFNTGKTIVYIGYGNSSNSYSYENANTQIPIKSMRNLEKDEPKIGVIHAVVVKIPLQASTTLIPEFIAVDT